MQPDDDEIDIILNHCFIAQDSGRSAYPGMSYEQGVLAAIDWMRGEADAPIDEADLFTEDD